MNELMTVKEVIEYVSNANDILNELKLSENADGKVLLNPNEVDRTKQCLSKFLQILQNGNVIFN